MKVSRYTEVADGAKIQAGDLLFGKLADGTTGWGKVPSWIVGEAFCQDHPMHGPWCMRKVTDEDRP